MVYYARVAQLVEHDLAKVGAAGSSPVSRFYIFSEKSQCQRDFLFYRKLLYICYNAAFKNAVVYEQREEKIFTNL